MRTALAYIYPTVRRVVYYPNADRFVQSYLAFGPGEQELDLHVYCNGPEPGPVDYKCFERLPVHWHQRDNFGWDIGAFQEAAEKLDCDLLICLGAAAHFHRPGWLDRIVQVYAENGPGLYGCACYLAPTQHVRTTMFWCPPELLQSYPLIVGSSKASRYEFEHGGMSFTRHVFNAGFPVLMVTWDGVFPVEQWSSHPFEPGVDGAPDRNNILIRDNHIN